MTVDDLPVGWVRVRLDEVAEVRLGRQRSPKNHAGDQMRPYLRAANVTWAGLDLSDVKEMNFTDDEVATYQLQPGDVLLSEASGSADEVGKPAIWRGEPSGPMCFQNTLLRVRSVAGVLPEYLHLRLLFECVSGGFARQSRGVGIHHLGAANLRALEIELPPADEQRRIVAALEEHLSQVEAGVQAVRALRVRVLRLRDAVRNGVVRRALHATGETTQATGTVADVQGGIQKQPARHASGCEGVPFLRVANVGRGTLDLADVHRILVRPSELPRALLEKGDLLVVEGNGSPDQIGRAALWDGSIEPCTHQNHLIRVRPAQNLVPDFLELVWNAPTTLAQLKSVASSTSGLYTLSTGKVKSVQIPVPEVADQMRFVAEAQAALTAVEQTIPALNLLERRVERLRHAVLSSAFHGRLTDQSLGDEPADVLLKRIVEQRAAMPTARGRRVRPILAARNAAGGMPVEETV